MKKLFLILCLILLSIKTYAYSKVDGKNIVLLTALERERYSNNETAYNEITYQRAEYFCKNIGLELQTYEFEEVYCEDVYKDSKNPCSQKLFNSVIPMKNSFRTASPEELETHFHDGGVAVAIVTLGFVPLVISYKTRIATDIKCSDSKKTYKVE